MELMATEVMPKVERAIAGTGTMKRAAVGR
jgi:hypothetical protein